MKTQSHIADPVSITEFLRSPLGIFIGKNGKTVDGLFVAVVDAIIVNKHALGKVTVVLPLHFNMHEA